MRDVFIRSLRYAAQVFISSGDGFPAVTERMTSENGRPSAGIGCVDAGIDDGNDRKPIRLILKGLLPNIFTITIAAFFVPGIWWR
jgi:hypothetical protein